MGPEAVLIAKMTALQDTENAVEVVQAPAPVVAQLELHVTGIAAVEHAEENGKRRVLIQAAHSLGALRNVCLIMQLLEPSATPRVQLSSRLPLQETLSGKTVLAVASASCSLHQLVER